MPKNAKTKAFKVRVNEEIKTQVALLASSRGCDESDIIRDALLQYLRRQPTETAIRRLIDYTPGTTLAEKLHNLNETPSDWGSADPQILSSETLSASAALEKAAAASVQDLQSSGPTPQTAEPAGDKSPPKRGVQPATAPPRSAPTPAPKKP